VYASDESGRFEIYIRPFPSTGDARWQISVDGGEAPRWVGDGGEVFYLAPGGTIKSLAVKLDARPDWSTSVTLFKRDVWVGSGPTRDLPGFDVTADGQTFLVNDQQHANITYTVILNWPRRLKEYAAAAHAP